MKIIILGDSTASIKEDSKRPETGWGEKLHLFLDKDINIINLAVNGRSTRSFINEDRFKEALTKVNKGDYVFIQFGHNDEKKDERFTSHYGTYQLNLIYMIDEVINHGGIPVIFSSITRRKYLSNHRISRYTVGLYPHVAKRVAHRKNVLFIDMFNNSRNILSYLGDNLSKKLFMILKENEHINYPLGLNDHTHLNEYGATVIASLVAEKLTKFNDFKDIVLKNKLLRRVEVKRALQ